MSLSMRTRLGWLIVLLLMAAGGCTSVRVTDPPRTATEQFMLSGAAAQAVSNISVDTLRGRRVWIDSTYFAASEQAFVLGEMRAHMIINGVRLVPKRDDAEIVCEVRSGGVGIDRYEFLLGIPPLLLPAGTVTSGTDLGSSIITPEIAALKNTRQLGFASVAFVAYWADTGELVSSSGPHIGRSDRTDWWIFGSGPRTVGTIPPADNKK